jgi:RNA polymerase sigma-70 factor (ECF subfamily)
VAQFERPLFYFIRRIVQNEADAWDALQKTWLRVFANLPTSPPTAGFKAWLYRVARNAALNHVRDESRHECDPLADPDQLTPADERRSFDIEDAAEVHAALDQLKRSDREALTLYFFDEFSVQEIGHVLGVPSGTVKSRLHFAKRRLRTILERNHD